jgi:hypothetical protein
MTGIMPYEFVRQVYYMQEKVLLDFHPDDDKYKEVLYEANLVLQELQSVEDWTWLRDRIVLGPCHHRHGEIPEFELPDWVYKESTGFHDTLKLYAHAHHHHHHHHHGHGEGDGHPYTGHHDWHCHRHGPGCDCGLLSPVNYIEVPFIGAGDNGHRRRHQLDLNGFYDGRDMRLHAIRVGNVITFDRALFPHEEHRVAVVDVQRKIPQIHVCTDFCKGINPDKPIDYSLDKHGHWKNPCREIEDRILTDIPDPNYVVMATAARHAEGSPPAQFRVQSLQDAAAKILSTMRQNDASYTDADYMDYDPIGFVEIV